MNLYPYRSIAKLQTAIPYCHSIVGMRYILWGSDLPGGLQYVETYFHTLLAMTPRTEICQHEKEPALSLQDFQQWLLAQFMCMGVLLFACFLNFHTLPFSTLK